MTLWAAAQPGQCLFCAFRSAAGRRSAATSQSVRYHARISKHVARSPSDGPYIARAHAFRRGRRDGLEKEDEEDDYEDLSVLLQQKKKLDSTEAAKSLNAQSADLKLRETPDEEIARKVLLIRNELPKLRILDSLQLSHKRLLKESSNYAIKVTDALKAKPGDPDAPLAQKLRTAARVGPLNLTLELKYGFYGFCMASCMPANNLLTKADRVVNLRHPAEWYHKTRTMKREWHLHVGPTNSGKTYHALKRLEEARSGVYAGPLRLLAHEVYLRLNAKGIQCTLITGDDRRAPAQGEQEMPNMISCTVEMVPLNPKFEVCVIDEIQMIADDERGWAWTQALLGIRAKEVHLCGEERSVQLIQELAATCGEQVHVHRYKRLSPLKMAGKSLKGNLRNLQKGDCIVAFSIVMIHTLRRAVEQTTGKKCAVIYGSLPPETRAQQAALFNDPDNDYDYLVASNAVGMGLNLSIKRLIFQSTWKTFGSKIERVDVPSIKQIAGRAGRYSSAAQDISRTSSDLENTVSNPIPPPKTVGLVTTLDKGDYDYVEASLDAQPAPLKSACLQAADFIIEKFARYFPIGTPFSYIIMRLYELSSTNSRFHLCTLKGQITVADALEGVKTLSISDRLIFCAAPIEVRKPGEPQLARALAKCVADLRPVTILDIEEIDFSPLYEGEGTQSRVVSRAYLSRLEQLHKAVIIYMWLSYRFMGIFTQQFLAQHIKSLVEDKIAQTLEKLSFNYKAMRRSQAKAIMDLIQEDQDRKEFLPEEESSATTATSPTIQEMLDEFGKQDPEFEKLRSGVVDENPPNPSVPSAH